MLAIQARIETDSGLQFADALTDALTRYGSQAAVARAWNVSNVAVHRWVKRYGIHTRLIAVIAS
jgi:hypothetical protein